MATIEIKNQGLYTVGDDGYNFEEDDNGSNPAGWTITETAGSVAVVDNISGQKKVLHFNDTDGGLTLYAGFEFAAAKSSGTFEFYIRNDDADDYIGLSLSDDFILTTSYITFYMDANWFTYWDAGAHTIVAASDNTWYHCSVRWRATGAAAYQGLAEGKMKVFINGTEYGDYNMRTDGSPSWAVFTTTGADLNYNAYIDAVAFDWDTSYTIGDNLLKPDTDITSDTIDFKIITEIGKIQKAITRIKSQTLADDDILQITDSQTSWQNGCGMYKDTCDFRNETIGSFPTQTDGGTWADNDGADCESIIIDKYNKHRYILQLRDQGAGAAIADLDITNTATGKVEFWMATTDPTYELTITLLDQQPAIHAGLQIDNENINYYHDGGWVDSGEDAEVGAWYRCVIHFCCALHKSIYTVYDSDGVEVFSVTNKDSPAPSSTVNDIKFTTQTTDANYICFIDAIGFDWDTSYTLGDNANMESTLADQTIFEGQITKQTREAIQKFNLISKAEELNQPVGSEQAAVTLTADYSPNMINELMDEYNHATATEQSMIFRGTYNGLYDSTTTDVTPTASDIPYGWIDSNGAGAVYTDVFSTEVGGHKNVFRLYDNVNGTTAGITTLFETQTYGSIEWYFRMSDVTKIAWMQFRDAANTNMVSFYVNADDLFRAAGPVKIMDIIDNTWYHCRLDFERTTGVYKGLAQNTYDLYVDGVLKCDGIALDNNVDLERITLNTSSGSFGYYFYIDALSFSWDWRYPECRDYDIGTGITVGTYQNKQILVDNIEPSGLAVADANIVIAGDISGQKIIKDFADKELMINYLNPSNAVCMDDGTNDSQIDFSSSDKIWAVRGEDRIQRINKVIVKGGSDGADRFYGEANNTDSQTTYGVKVAFVYAGEIDSDTDLDLLAAKILEEHENAPDQVILWRLCSTEGMMQVGETVTISASDIRYARNTDYITAGQWIIRKIDYYPLTQIARIWLIDSLIYTPDEKELESIEKLINAGLI